MDLQEMASVHHLEQYCVNDNKEIDIEELFKILEDSQEMLRAHQLERMDIVNEPISFNDISLMWTDSQEMASAYRAIELPEVHFSEKAEMGKQVETLTKRVAELGGLNANLEAKAKGVEAKAMGFGLHIKNLEESLVAANLERSRLEGLNVNLEAKAKGIEAKAMGFGFHIKNLEESLVAARIRAEVAEKRIANMEAASSNLERYRLEGQVTFLKRCLEEAQQLIAVKDGVVADLSLQVSTLDGERGWGSESPTAAAADALVLLKESSGALG